VKKALPIGHGNLASRRHFLGSAGAATLAPVAPAANRLTHGMSDAIMASCRVADEGYCLPPRASIRALVRSGGIGFGWRRSASRRWSR